MKVEEGWYSDYSEEDCAGESEDEEEEEEEEEDGRGRWVVEGGGGSESVESGGGRSGGVREMIEGRAVEEGEIVNKEEEKETVDFEMVDMDVIIDGTDGDG